MGAAALAGRPRPTACSASSPRAIDPVNHTNSLTATPGTRLAIAAVGVERCTREMPVLRPGPAPEHAVACHFAFAGERLEILLAVNGTLMRGLELNGNLLAAGARFVRETTTAPEYRLWSIGDRHPAMLRSGAGGAALAVEVWQVPAAGLAQILLSEPPGLCIGKVRLAGGEETLGVLGEPALCEGQPEITRHGGWRAYVASRGDRT